ncbi:26S proteasome subunit RPN7-domain-containing protein [Mrakia frigida]|uniref:COP9 signalosome complex subunit 1 n=1 Tax=Mrakia frigida TaxID=29902 RepID=UPI003FCC092B
MDPLDDEDSLMSNVIHASNEGGSSSIPSLLNGHGNTLSSSASFSAPAAPSSSSRVYSSHQIVNVDDKHPFDLDLIVNQFTGRALLIRLAFIYSSVPSLRSKISAIALPIVKAETYDPLLWDQLGGSATDPWRREVQSVSRGEIEKLETELKTVQANLIKESIRMCHVDLAKLYLKCGDPQGALKSFVKTREFNSTGQQMLEMCMSIIEVDITLHAYLQIPPYIVKAEAALERPQSSLLGSANPSIPLSAAQARAREEELARVEEEKKITTTRLQVARALSSLGQGAYEQAARQFLQVKGELGSWAKTVISPSELAIYGSLCAVATLRRSALKSELLGNESFRAFVDEESYVRDIVDSFVEGKYKIALDLLETHSARHLLTPHLAHHLSNLTQSVRRRALIQYFQPFESVKLSRMGTAFGMKEEEVLRMVIELVESGEIDGRVDLPNKVLRARKEDPRSKLFYDAMRDGEKAVASTQRAVLRMAMVENDLIVKNPKSDRKERSSRAGGGGGNDLSEAILVDE